MVENKVFSRYMPNDTPKIRKRMMKEIGIKSEEGWPLLFCAQPPPDKRFLKRRDAPELYNLSSDPKQMNNVF